MQALERQIERSSGAIGSSLKGLAGLFAAAFSAQQVAQMADTYTRFTNQLKVAGLEGENLAATQQRLYQVAQQNGVAIEAVGTLYSRAAQNQKELGASTDDLINLTRAVAASLRISGTSTEEASGALLQLGQALGSPRIQAEEFNSLLDTMQPLLREAAKYIDGTGGSLAGLTRVIKDTSGAGVSNVQFFEAIGKALAALEGDAKSADLTLSGAFTNIKNSLDLFVGQALNDSGLIDSVTNAAAKLGEQIEDSGSVVRQTGTVMATAFGLLAENLGTLIETITVLTTVIGVRYVAAQGAAALATLATVASEERDIQAKAVLTTATYQANAALLGQASAARIAAESVTGLSVAQGVAARSASGLLALVGGPYGAAILALGAGIYALSNYTRGNTEATGVYAKQQKIAAEATDRAEKAVTALATAHGKARDQAIAAARAEQENIKQKYASARASLDLAAAELARAKAFQSAQADAAASAGGTAPGLTGGVMNMTGQRAVNNATANYNAQVKTLNDLGRSFKRTQTALNASAVASAPATGAKSSKPKKGSIKSAPAMATAADQQRELDRLTLEELRAKLDLATSAEDRAGLQREILAQEKSSRVREIQADERFTKAQKDAQIKALEKLYGPQTPESGDITVSPSLLGKAVDRDYQQAMDRVADGLLASQQAALEALADIEPNTKARAALEMRALEIQQQIERNLLEQEIATGDLASATKEQQDQARKNLAVEQGARRDRSVRENEGPLASYSRKLRETDVNDQIESYVVDELQSVQDSIASGIQKKLGVKDPLLAGLINLFIEQNIIKPLANALAQSGSGGGGLGGLVAGITTFLRPSVSTPGRAIGGPVKAGVPYLVGENGGPQGRELFVPQQSGTIIPNHRLRGNSGAPVVNQTFVLDARGGITTPELLEYVNTTARRESSNAAGGAYVQSQQSAPGTLNKYNQLRG